MKDKRYIWSFLDNDPQLQEWNTLAFSDNALDVDPQGVVWAVDAPVLKVFRVDTAAGREQGFPIRSALAKPVGKIEAGSDKRALYDSSYLLDRVLAVGGHAVVAIRGPKGKDGLLAVFDGKGRQVVTDLKPPGTLAGKTRDGHLLFVKALKGSFEIGEYALTLPPPGKAGR